MAGVAELLEGVVERGGLDGEDYGAVLAADEVEAAFLLDELELRGHWLRLSALFSGKRRPPRKTVRDGRRRPPRKAAAT